MCHAPLDGTGPRIAGRSTPVHHSIRMKPSPRRLRCCAGTDVGARAVGGACSICHERSVGPLSATARTSSVAGEAEQAESQPLLAKGMLVLFIALIACFTAWGVAQDLTTPMVAGFKRIFDMSTFQASLVQLAYFGAYF